MSVILVLLLYVKHENIRARRQIQKQTTTSNLVLFDAEDLYTAICVICVSNVYVIIISDFYPR